MRIGPLRTLCQRSGGPDLFRKRTTEPDTTLNGLVSESEKLRYELLRTAAQLEGFASQLTDQANHLRATATMESTDARFNQGATGTTAVAGP